MARTSRKKHLQIEGLPKKNVQFKAGMYLRLSVENNEEGNSLESQEAIIRQYLEDKDDFAIVERYCDNGVTGTHFDRPSFQKMMEDVKTKKINCILVKDLSRFGRNHVGVGQYLETVFPFLGVRMIAINDGYDNFSSTHSDELIMHLLNISNDIYARDISAKISPVLHGKQERGEYMGPFPVYGYVRNPKDDRKLIVDPEAAEVVKLVFELKRNGLGYSKIIQYLNEKAIPSPSEYRLSKGISRCSLLNNGYWNMRRVKLILQNQTYCGHTVGGKYRASLADNIKRYEVPKEEWLVVKNTHEAIISESLFQEIQAMLADSKQKYEDNIERTKKIPKTANLFLNLVVCGQCGERLYRVRNIWSTADGTRRVTYRFNHSQHRDRRKVKHCKPQGVTELSIQEAIRVQYLEKTLLYKETLAKRDKLGEKKQTEKEIESLLLTNKKCFNQLQNIQHRNDDVFDKFIDDKISQKEYQMLRDQYAQQIDLLKLELEENQNRVQFLQKLLLAETNDLAICEEFVFSQENVTSLISEIIVHSAENIQVVFSFENELCVEV